MALKRLKWATSLKPCTSNVLMGHYVGSKIIVSAVDYTLLGDGAVVFVPRHYPEIYPIVLKENRGEIISRASNQADN